MRSLRVAIPLLTLAMALAACSSGASAGGSPAASAAPSAAASAAPSAAAGGITLNLADSSLGKILTDGAGKTLYVFTADSAGKSACAGDCAKTWPPLASDAAPTVGTGLDASSFSTISRDDGTTQVTFDGQPLYYFAGDQAAGDTKGQGLLGKWFVVGADGKAMSAGAAQSAAPSAAASGVTINLADSSLGKILTDGDGKTLYVFTADSSGKSACAGSCQDNWPPLTADGAPKLGTGLDAEDFTTITRSDGSKQVAFYGQPLYYFAGDKAAGDTNGENVGGKWFVVGGDGKLIKPAAASGGTSY